MRRLQDGQAVSLEVESLETNLECLVIAIEGDEATLDPIYHAFSMSVPTTGTNSMLTFEHQGRQVGWRSALRYSGIADEDRERLKCFVAERKRERLAQQRERA